MEWLRREMAGEQLSSVYRNKERLEFKWILFRACLDWNFARDVVRVCVSRSFVAFVYERSLQS